MHADKLAASFPSCFLSKWTNDEVDIYEDAASSQQHLCMHAFPALPSFVCLLPRLLAFSMSTNPWSILSDKESWSKLKDVLTPLKISTSLENTLFRHMYVVLDFFKYVDFEIFEMRKIMCHYGSLGKHATWFWIVNTLHFFSVVLSFPPLLFNRYYFFFLFFKLRFRISFRRFPPGDIRWLILKLALGIPNGSNCTAFASIRRFWRSKFDIFDLFQWVGNWKNEFLVDNAITCKTFLWRLAKLSAQNLPGGDILNLKLAWLFQRVSISTEQCCKSQSHKLPSASFSSPRSCLISACQTLSLNLSKYRLYLLFPPPPSFSSPNNSPSFSSFCSSSGICSSHTEWVICWARHHLHEDQQLLIW